MKNELTDDESLSAKRIMQELCGYTLKQAENILKYVTGEIKNRAVIEDN